MNVNRQQCKKWKECSQIFGWMDSNENFVCALLEKDFSVLKAETTDWMINIQIKVTG